LTETLAFFVKLWYSSLERDTNVHYGTFYYYITKVKRCQAVLGGLALFFYIFLNSEQKQPFSACFCPCFCKLLENLTAIIHRLFLPFSYRKTLKKRFRFEKAYTLPRVSFSFLFSFFATKPVYFCTIIV